MDPQMDNDPEFENLSLLLPFYVNGTLDAAACAKVDAALATSAELREELAEIGRLAQGVKAGGRAFGHGDAAGAQRVATKLAEVRSPAPIAMPSDRLGGMLAFLNPRSWHPAVALSLALAVLAQAAVIANLNGENTQRSSKIASLEKRLGEVEFQLASGPGGGAVQKGSILVQLAPDASWADVETLLANENLEIVGGPSDGALMLSSDAKDAALDLQIKRLKASALIAAADKAV
jgi:hypothetical protein